MKILQVVGYKNSGKTTVINDMVKELKSSGYRVAVIKHHHEAGTFETTTDTGKFIHSGSDITILNTPQSSMKVKSVTPSLSAQVEELSGAVDFILIEGYKDENYPKIYLEYSFTNGAAPLKTLSLEAVLMTFDLRYDRNKVMDWFQNWSER